MGIGHQSDHAAAWRQQPLGAEGRASNVKEIDRNKAHAAVLAEQKRLDAVKAAAAASTPAAGSDSLI